MVQAYFKFITGKLVISGVRHVVFALLLVIPSVLCGQERPSYTQLIEDASLALDQGHYQDAIRAYSQAIALQGGRYEAYLGRAMSYHAFSENQKAVIDFTTVIEIDPSIREAYYGRAVIHHDQERYALAYHDFLTLTEMPPAETNTVFFKTRAGEEGVSSLSTLKDMEADIYAYLGDVCSELGKTDSSDFFFQKALEMEPFNADIRVNVAQSYQKHGNVDLAIEEYGNALSIDPENAIAMYNLAIIARQTDSQQAREIFDLVIMKNPNIAEAYEHRALASFEEGRYEEALKDYETAISLDKGDPGKWYNTGLILEKLNQLTPAYKAFTEALELGGDKGLLYRNRANILFKMKDYETAEADYTRALKYEPTNELSYYNRALARNNLGKTQGACADITEAAKLGMEQAVRIRSKICK